MECLEVLIKDIQQFFGDLESHICKIEELLKKSQKPCSSIGNQCLILHSVLPKDSLEKTGLENLKNFKDLLVNCIINSVGKDLELLLSIRNDFTTTLTDLWEKYEVIHRSYKIVQGKNLVYSSVLNPASPRLEHIIDWSLDVCRYYHGLNLQISVALENLNFEDSESVKALLESFKENDNLKQEVNLIRSFEFHLFPFIE